MTNYELANVLTVVARSLKSGVSIAEAFGLVADTLLKLDDSSTESKTKTALTDDSPMPFGKHRGTKLRDVAPDYFRWLCSQAEPVRHTGLRAYLEEKGYAKAKATNNEEIIPF